MTRDPDAPRHAVLLDRSTMHPRYDSAELIEYDRAAWLTRRDRAVDPEALAGALRRLIDDPAGRARRGAASRARAEARDWGWAWRNPRYVLDGL